MEENLDSVADIVQAPIELEDVSLSRSVGTDDRIHSDRTYLRDQFVRVVAGIPYKMPSACVLKQVSCDCHLVAIAGC